MRAGQVSQTGAWQKDITERLGQASLSSLRSVGASLANGIKAGYDSLTVDSSDKELVSFVKFAELEFRTSRGIETRRALLLGYQNGFQVWDLEDGRLTRELASKRDGAVRYSPWQLSIPFSLHWRPLSSMLRFAVASLR